MRLLTYLPGTTISKVTVTPQLLYETGRIGATMDQILLKVKTHLDKISFLFPVRDAMPKSAVENCKGSIGNIGIVVISNSTCQLWLAW